MSAYYNENDPYAAAWLRKLIEAKLIAKGEVDERSIVEVKASDIRGYTQCHFFAGIGGWSHALRLAGWSDKREVWTGSCPCQPFSVAGKRQGEKDERHLWPAFRDLIRKCRPSVVFGEQVASKDALGWLDAVHADMERSRYAFAAVDLCAAGVGAPHIRQRLWWVADAGIQRRQQNTRGASSDEKAHGRARRVGGESNCDYVVAGSRSVSRMADALHAGRAEGVAGAGDRQTAGSRELDRAADGQREGLEGRDTRAVGQKRTPVERGGGVGRGEHADMPGEYEWAPGWEQSLRELGATGGYWGGADWLYCLDRTLRPVEPGTFPLAHGVSNRMGRLRAYGNAIVPQVAAEVIHAFMECRP